MRAPDPRALALLAALACTADPPPEPTPIASPPAPPATVELRLTDGVTAVRAPSDFVPLDPEQIERLRAAGTRHEPSARIELLGRRSPRGIAHGMAVAVRSVNDDLPTFYGETVRSLVTRTVHQAKKEAPLKDGKGTIAIEEAPEGASLDIVLTLPMANEPGFRTRTRYWATATTTYQHGCQCGGDGCIGDGECSLPNAPVDALSIDAPITGDIPAVEHSLEGASFSISEMLREMAMERRTQMIADERARSPDMRAFDIRGWLGRREDAGAAFLSAAQWCRPNDPRCDLEGVAKRSLEVARSEARSGGIEPEVAVRIAYDNGRAVHHLEIRAGNVTWERRLLWQDDAVVHELACMCGGPACATVERTCKLAPPDASADLAR